MQSPAYYMKKYGTSYYYATLFFPRAIQKDVMTLYTFVRIPDLVVDVKNSDMKKAYDDLLSMREEWEHAYNEKNIMHDTRGASVELFYRCNIRFDLSKTFWDAMLQDTNKFCYADYLELQAYMFGSAMVVGEMMCAVIGNENPDAIPYAHALGEAMQLTNFLRDVKEDWCDLGRIYMPDEELLQFGVSRNMIHDFCEKGVINDNRKEFMKFQIARADALYAEAIEGVAYLPAFSRKAIYISAKLYQGILRKIERLDYNVFAKSARTSKVDKLLILIKHFRISF